MVQITPADRIWEKVSDIGLKNKCIIDYIVECSESERGIAICTLRHIAAKTGRSLSTTHMVVKRLRKEGFVDMLTHGVYRIKKLDIPIEDVEGIIENA